MFCSLCREPAVSVFSQVNGLEYTQITQNASTDSSASGRLQENMNNHHREHLSKGQVIIHHREHLNKGQVINLAEWSYAMVPPAVCRPSRGIVWYLP